MKIYKSVSKFNNKISSVWRFISLWHLSLKLVLNLFEQILHENCFNSFPHDTTGTLCTLWIVHSKDSSFWCLSTCLYSFHLSRNLYSHFMHLTLFKIEWYFWWLSNSFPSLLYSEHTSHKKGLPSAWTYECLFRCDFVRNVFLQIVHE